MILSVNSEPIKQIVFNVEFLPLHLDVSIDKADEGV